mmetsp:Transcript_116385/g.205806  ORF Transcript_116385/g.205806 Transcript_116385/m.205806 type:complete len:157 (-) Transcript_116385:463-933(-)
MNDVFPSAEIAASTLGLSSGKKLIAMDPGCTSLHVFGAKALEVDTISITLGTIALEVATAGTSALEVDTISVTVGTIADDAIECWTTDAAFCAGGCGADMVPADKVPAVTDAGFVDVSAVIYRALGGGGGGPTDTDPEVFTTLTAAFVDADFCGVN